MGRAGRRARHRQPLASRQGDDPARPGEGAAPPLPAHLPAAKPQPPAAPEGAGRGRRAARRRGVRRLRGHRRHLGARRAPRRREGPAPGLAERRIGRRDQAQAWVWRLASHTRELHEEYAVQRWPETKRLLGLFVNSSGRAHGRNARRMVNAARQQDRRLPVSLLAAAVAHTPEAEEVLRGARMRLARKPSAVARELLRELPKAGCEAPASAKATRAARARTARRPTATASPGARREARGRGGGRSRCSLTPHRVSEPYGWIRRLTSPEPRATCSPSAVSTMRLPLASTPAAVPIRGVVPPPPPSSI